MDLEQLKEIIKIFETSSLSELEIEEKGIRFRLAKQVEKILSKEVEKPLPPVGPKEKKKEGRVIFVRSPLVGTFYRAPSPEEEPFVEVGDEVVFGQTLCIIEAMKVMNEITSEVKGRIREILVENGQPVEYDQELFLIEEK